MALPSESGTTGRFTLARLLGALGVILVLSFAVPPTVAIGVHRSRLARAVADAASIAGALGQFHRAHGEWPGCEPARGVDHGPPIDLLVGPGSVPREAGGNDWRSGHLYSLGDRLGARIGPDPWGNRYLANIRCGVTPAAPPEGGAESKAIWVLSAGPNGLIETPFEQPAVEAVLGGDDVGIRVR